MKYSLVSPKIYEDEFQKAKLYKEEAIENFCGWIILATNEDKSYIDDDGDFMMMRIENSLIEEYLPDFKNIQNAPVNAMYVHNTGFDKLVQIQQHEHQTSYASNQANIEMNIWHWLKYEWQPLWKQFLWIIFAICIIPLIFPFTLIVSFFVIYDSYTTIKQSIDSYKHFYKYADTIAGIVIGTNPTRIAMTTDLSKRFGYYPIIKIETYKFSKLLGEKIKVGDKLPMITTYCDENNPNYWSDIFPKPAVFGTKDKNILGKKKYSISVEEWNLLEDNLYQINPKKNGVYKLDVEGSHWLK